MGEWREFVNLRQYRVPYRITLLAVFFLTVIFDLTVAVEVGLIAACVTFIYRISSLSRSERVNATDQPLLVGQSGRIEAYRIYGAIFFGAVKLVQEIEAHLPSHTLVLDLKNVIYMDSSGVDTLLDLVKTCQKNNVHLVVCGLMHQPLDIAQRTGLVKLLADPGREDPVSLESSLPLTLADGLLEAVKTTLPSL
jgi:sulfate permease, SulP family